MIKTCGFFAMLSAFALGTATPSVAKVVAPPVSTLEIIDVSGKWLDTTDGTDVRGLDTNTVRWGNPVNETGAKSGYGFRGVQDSRAQQPETDFRLGNFTHFNRVIGLGTSITAARLRVSFRVKIVDATNGISRVVRAFSTFDFRHLETPNNAPTCADGNANGTGLNSNGCADRVTLVYNPDFSNSFRLGSAVYTLDITGFDMATPFWTTENAANQRSLFGHFTTTPDLVDGEGGGGTSPVPLPAAGWMLVAGLGSLAGLARRVRRRS